MSSVNKVLIIFIIVQLSISVAFSQTRPYSDDSLLLSLPVDDGISQKMFKEIDIYADDSIRINGFERTTPKNKALIVYFHGNGESLWFNGLQKKLSFLHKNGFNILAIDYPGYGKSKGKETVENLYRFADSTYNYVNKKYPGYTIIIWGQSLGTIPAIYLARNRRVDLLISEGTITVLPDLKNSLEAVYSTGQQKVFFEIDSNRHFNNYEMIQGVKSRAVFIHGDNDLIAKTQYAKKLYDEFDSDKKQLILLPGAGHNYGLNQIKGYVKTIQDIVATEL